MTVANYALNPGLEAATAKQATGFTLGSMNGTIVWDDADPYIGSRAQRVDYTISGSDGNTLFYQPQESAAGSFASGDALSVAVRIKGTIPAGLRMRINASARKADGSAISFLPSASSYVTTLGDGFYKLKVEGLTCPALTDHIRIQVQVWRTDGTSLGAGNAGTNIVLDFDAVQIVKASTAGTYVSGGHGGTWDGATNNSTSTRAAAAITSLEPSSGLVSDHLLIHCSDAGLSDAANSVSMGGQAAAVTSWTETLIDVVVPDLSPGVQSVAFVPGGDGGGTTSPGSNYTVLAADPITFVAAGAQAAAASGDLDVAAPADALIDPNDILLLVVFSHDNVTPTADNGYGAPYKTATQNGRRLTLFWKRTSGSEGTTHVGHTGGDAVLANISAWRGVKTSGLPFAAASSSSTAANSTAVQLPTLTTEMPNSVVLMLAGSQGASTWVTNAVGNLTSVAERFDGSTALGADASLTVQSGKLADAGATGTLSLTQTVSCLYLAMLVALAPAESQPLPYHGQRLIHMSDGSNLACHRRIYNGGEWVECPRYTFDGEQWLLIDTLQGQEDERVAYVPSGATSNQIDAAIAEAIAMGPGAWVEFPAEHLIYANNSGHLLHPDYINFRGQAIWNQGIEGGDGGTWIDCTRYEWGSDSKAEKLLIGSNGTASGCVHRPLPKGTTSAVNTATAAHGSIGCQFTLVRYKGGSDTGGHLFDLSSNFSNDWTSSLKLYTMKDSEWDDCEFERPQLDYAYWSAHTSTGSIMNIWWDCREGGAEVSGLKFRRCHFGVMNSRTGRTGTDRYGCGRVLLFQPAPSLAGKVNGPTTDGNSVCTSANYNASFDWGLLDHNCHDVLFDHCLFEHTYWYRLDVCDHARTWSMWHGVQAGYADGGGSHGYGNPPGYQALIFPAKVWTMNFSLDGCYHKGNRGNSHGTVFEVGHSCLVTNSFGISVSSSGSYGNLNSGSFLPAGRPVSAIFPAETDWEGTCYTSGGVFYGAYTASPYDPA